MNEAVGGARRHYGMDWLRIGAFALLIGYHIGMFFVPWDWHVKSDPVEQWVTLPMLLVNGWRLSLLFLVSGYASAAMLERRPALGAFVGQRSARLLVPVLFGMAVIVPPQPWVELVVKHGYAHGFGHFWLNDYFRFGELNGLDMPTWQHLWFVVYLWVYTMVFAGVTSLLPATLRARIRAAAARVLAYPALLLLLPIGWLLLRTMVVFPGVGESHDLFTDASAHMLYLPMFLFGFLLQRGEAIWPAIHRIWPVAALLAAICSVVVVCLEYRYPGATPVPEPLMTIFVAARAVQAWTAILLLLHLATRYLDRDGPGRAMLTEAVFPFYIVHQTLIVVLGYASLRMGLGNAAALALILAGTVAGCWLFYLIGRAIAPLRPLIGLRRRHGGSGQVGVASKA